MELDINLLKNTAERILNKHQLPGMGIGVVSSKETLFIGGFGYSEIETKTKHTENPIQRIGSITKTMTALAAMRLVENGKLDMTAMNKVIDESVIKRNKEIGISKKDRMDIMFSSMRIRWYYG